MNDFHQPSRVVVETYRPGFKHVPTESPLDKNPTSGKATGKFILSAVAASSIGYLASQHNLNISPAILRNDLSQIRTSVLAHLSTGRGAF